MSKLLAVENSKALCDLLDRSSILSRPQLDTARKLSERISDAKELAGKLVKGGILTRWQAQQLLRGFVTLQLGKFQLLDEMEAGPIGKVYLGEHKQLARRVALKLLPKGMKERPKIAEKLLQAARRICALDHRNIIHVFDIDLDLDRYFLVMEFPAGKTLAEHLTNGPLRFSAAADIIRQVAAGLHYAHQSGVYHGDLQPSNVLIEKNGAVKILDFGVTRLIAEISEPREPNVGDLRRSFFQAPELSNQHVTTAQDSNRGQQADLFALGRLLHCALSGSSDYPADAMPDLLQERQGIPSELVQLVLDLTQLDPQKRPKSAEQVEKSLEIWLGKQIVTRNDEESQPIEDVNESRDPFSTAAMSAVRCVDSGASMPTLDQMLTERAAADTGGFEIRLNSPTRSTKSRTAKSRTAKSRTAKSCTAKAGSSIKQGPRKIGRRLWIVGVTVVFVAAMGIGYVFWPTGRGVVDDHRGQSAPSSLAQQAPTPNSDKSLAGASIPALEVNSLRRAPARSAENESLRTDRLPLPEDRAIAAANHLTSAPANASTIDADSTFVPTVEKPLDSPAAVSPAVESASPPSATPPVESALPGPIPPTDTTANPTPDSTNPAESKPKVDPFEGFPLAVDLPALEEGLATGSNESAAFELGKVLIDRKAFCIVHLHGGNVACPKPKQQFELQEESERAWRVICRDGAAEGVHIANLRLEMQQLNFTWTAQGVKDPVSPYLANCVLTIAAGPKSRDLALRKPTAGPPMSFGDMCKRMRAQWDIPHPPRLDHLRLTFKLSANAPKHVFEPESNVPFDKPTAKLAFVDPENTPILGLQLDFQLKKLLVVNATTFVRLATDDAPVKLSVKVLNERTKSLPIWSQRIEAAVGQAKLLSEQKSTDEGLRNEYLRAEEKMKVWQKAVGQFEKVKELLNQADAIQLQVSITHDADDKSILLFSTTP